MEIKKCYKCGVEKTLNEFYNDKNKKDGKTGVCKNCAILKAKKYRHSKIGLIRQLYQNQIKASKKRGHPPPTYTFIELYEWVINQPHFEELYQNWVNSGYRRKLVPSIDRLNDNKGYSFDNIRLVKWEENNKKEIEKQKKKVNMYDLNGKYIKTWKSLSAAHRKGGFDFRNISVCCNFNRNFYKGFQWRYLSEEYPKYKDIPPVKPFTSKYIGVYSNNKFNYWSVEITINKNRLRAGFKIELEAAYFYDLVIEYFNLKRNKNNVKHLLNYEQKQKVENKFNKKLKNFKVKGVK